MTEVVGTEQITASDLLQLAKKANVLRLLGLSRGKPVTVDYRPEQPARHSIRPKGAVGPPESPVVPIFSLTFHLEDAEFGTRTFVAVTCQGRIVVNPFPWESYEHLTTLVIT